MVEIGDDAPDFTVPKAGGTANNDIESFTLSDQLGDGPIVLAFFPGAFTSTCTEEVCAFRDSMDSFDDLDAQVYGITVDTPPALNVWIREQQLNFPMLSDWNHEVIHKYDVVIDQMYGLYEAAQRSIFVIDADGTITYRWIADRNPDFDAVIPEVQDAVDAASKS